MTAYRASTPRVGPHPGPLEIEQRGADQLPQLRTGLHLVEHIVARPACGVPAAMVKVQFDFPAALFACLPEGV